jgi:hypothetical protein
LDDGPGIASRVDSQGEFGLTDSFVKVLYAVLSVLLDEFLESREEAINIPVKFLTNGINVHRLPTDPVNVPPGLPVA